MHGLTEYRGQVTAKVAGTEDYRVKLWAERGRLDCSCSCPVGDDGEFCKHCVAVALAWIEESGGKGKKSTVKKSAATMEDVRAFLERQDKGMLIEMLLSEALESDSLRERLLLETARMNPERIDLATYR
ncbi:MAG: SWIM zinc finger family protein, partial [Acidobacteria bacterium]|nr:SWIM zinc finger family protein [Acidobacteriota bacterium]